MQLKKLAAFLVVPTFLVLIGLFGASAPAFAADAENTMIITLKDGDVTIALRPDLAPKHVAQIKKLVRDGMLYMGNGARITRIHGPFVSDEEVEEIVTHLKSFGPPQYMSGVVEGPEDDVASDIDAVLGLTGGNTEGEDALYDQAVAIVARDRKCSTSYIQRKLGIGYNKAARLVEQMEEQGVVTPANHVGKREILIPEA